MIFPDLYSEIACPFTYEKANLLEISCLLVQFIKSMDRVILSAE